MKSLEDLTALEVKLLLRCRAQPLSKFQISQAFKRVPLPSRQEVLYGLVTKGYLSERRMPKPGARKTPTYYFITAKGEAWVDNYLSVFG